VDSGKPVYCVNDPSVVLAHDPKAQPVGPKRLLATTLGDWLKTASPQSRVVAVSAKDRAAIIMAGHKADGVFWLVEGLGFTTFMAPGGDASQALAPMAAYNAELAPVWTRRPTWTYLHADCKAKAADWVVNGQIFQSRLPPTDWGQSDDPGVIKSQVLASPLADEMTGEAARRLITAYNLGRGPAPDLLAVSFSATDFVGHHYGTRGPEMCEQMHRLDETIGRLLAEVDRLKIPYMVVLSADHGGSDLTERLQVEGYPMAKRVTSAPVMAQVNAALMAELDLKTPPLAGSVEESEVVGIPDADKDRVAAAAARILSAQPEVAGAFTLKDLLTSPVRPGVPPDELTLKERFSLSTYAGRSPDVLAALKPQSTLSPPMPGVLVASHGSPWDYDRRVPMLFWWPGVTPEARFLPVETVDIAPTLAAAWGLTPPADIDGRCLALAADHPC